MNVVPFKLPKPVQGFDQATADMIVASDVISTFITANLRTKCAVVQSAVDSGKTVGQLTVDELVAFIHRENAR